MSLYLHGFVPLGLFQAAFQLCNKRGGWNKERLLLWSGVGGGVGSEEGDWPPSDADQKIKGNDLFQIRTPLSRSSHSVYKRQKLIYYHRNCL